MLTCLFSRLTAAVLLLFVTVCRAEPHHLPENGPIPDADIAADMQAVDAAIQTPWVERNPSGVQRLETKRQSFSLTDAQKALFDRHWELETISREKPTAPKQVDMELLADALDVVVEMHEPEKAVWLRMDKLEAWANGGVGNGGVGQQQIEAEKRTEMEDEAKERGGKPVQLTNLIGEDAGQADEEVDAAANEQCDEKDKPKIVAALNVTLPVSAENLIKQVEAQNASENTQTEQETPLKITSTENGPKVVMIVVGDGNTVAFTQDEASDEAKPMVKVETVPKSDEDDEKVEEVKNDVEKEENDENAVETVKTESQLIPGSEEDEKAVFQAIQAVNEQKQRQIQHAVPGVLVVDLKKPEDEEESVEEENAGNTGMPQVEVVQLQEDAPNGSVEVVESPKEEVVQQQQNTQEGNAFLRGLGVLSRLLLGGRAKRSTDEEAVPVGNGTVPAMVTKESTQTETEDTEKKPKTLKMMRSFMGRMQMGNGTLGISAMYEMTMNAPNKEDGDKKEEDEDEVEGESKEPIKVEKTEKAVEDKKPMLSFLIPFRVLAPAAEPENVVEPEEQLLPEENLEKENEFPKLVKMKPEPIENVPVENSSEMKKALSDKEKIAAISAVQSQMDSPKIHEEKAPIPEEQAKQEIINYLASGIAKTAGPKKDEKLAYIWYSELQYWLAKRIEHDFAKSGMTSVVDVLGLPAGGVGLLNFLFFYY